MATRSLNELIYEIIDLYRASIKVTDPLDERSVITWIQHTRAKLLKQRFDEPFVPIDEHNIQSLDAVELALSDSAKDGYFMDFPKSNHKILRTVNPLPSTINRRNNIGTFTRIGFIDMYQPVINMVTRERALVSGNGKFNQDTVYAFLDGKRMYFVCKNHLCNNVQYVNIKGVFANPIEAYEFVNGVGSYNWDNEYPISESIVTDMKAMILKDNFSFVLTQLQDESNNASNDMVNLRVK